MLAVLVFIILIIYFEDTRFSCCLRHWDTSREVAGSIYDGVIGIFYRRNASGLTMVLGSTQLLTEMNTRKNS